MLLNSSLNFWGVVTDIEGQVRIAPEAPVCDMDGPKDGSRVATGWPSQEGMNLSEAMSLDPSALDMLRELQEPGESDILQELIAIFMDDAPRHCVSMRTAYDRGDADGMARAAHSLKSSSGNMGAMRLSELCGEIEELGFSDRAAEAGHLVEELVKEMALVAELLKTEITPV